MVYAYLALKHVSISSLQTRYYTAKHHAQKESTGGKNTKISFISLLSWRFVYVRINIETQQWTRDFQILLGLLIAKR